MHRCLPRVTVRPGLRSYQSTPARTRRFQSTSPPRSSWKQALNTESPILVQENFPKHFVFVLDVGKRFLKFSFIGLALLGIAAGSVYEGAHIWAEKNGLAPESDDEVRAWQWLSDADKWTGPPVHGGTDPGLGFKTRHLVRAAWMAYTWGIGHTTTAVGTFDEHGSGLAGPAGIKVINPQLQLTEDFLRVAIRFAESSSNKLYPQTLPKLFILHSNMLEKLGDDFLPEAKSELERAWAGLDANSLDAARVALKLGDVNSRLGSEDHALEWWTRTLQLVNEKSVPTIPEPVDLIPKQPPSSPLAQRLLSSTLISLSAFYAKSGQLRKAEAIEENALALLRAIRPPDSLASASPPQALHALFLLQRSSILSIHLAEVLYAQKRPAMTSIQWLTFAAESSERVARALTGLPLIKSDEFPARNPLPHPLEQHLLVPYSGSRTMKPVAEGLLRDARRTAAEAWNLMGVLHEVREGKKSKAALECFGRAVEWAGSPSSEADGGKEAAEGIPEADWRVIWSNYRRLKRNAEDS